MDNSTPVSAKPISPLAKHILGYALAFAMAYIAAKWGIVPSPAPGPVIVMPPPVTTTLVQP